MFYAKRKIPGCDGRPVEFYKHFWNILQNPLFNLLKKKNLKQMFKKKIHYTRRNVNNHETRTDLLYTQT